MKLSTIIILLLSLPVFILGIAQSLKGFVSKWWTQIPPSNLQFKIIKTSIDGSQFWSPIIEGSYEFGGKSYKLSRIEFGDCSVSSETEAQKNLDKYQLAFRYVYVNPMKPMEHVLFPGVKARTSLMILLGLFFFILAGLTEMELLPVDGIGPAGL